MKPGYVYIGKGEPLRPVVVFFVVQRVARELSDESIPELTKREIQRLLPGLYAASFDPEPSFAGGGKKYLFTIGKKLDPDREIERLSEMVSAGWSRPGYKSLYPGIGEEIKKASRLRRMTRAQVEDKERLLYKLKKAKERIEAEERA